MHGCQHWSLFWLLCNQSIVFLEAALLFFASNSWSSVRDFGWHCKSSVPSMSTDKFEFQWKKAARRDDRDYYHDHRNKQFGNSWDCVSKSQCGDWVTGTFERLHLLAISVSFVMVISFRFEMKLISAWHRNREGKLARISFDHSFFFNLINFRYILWIHFSNISFKELL